MDQPEEKVSKRSVRYRIGSRTEHCGNCSMYAADGNRPMQGTCTLVRGVILPSMLCDKWEKK